MIKSKHTLSYCPGCQTEMVKCGSCNNNCCNGGNGKANGSGPGGTGPDCPDCNDAYDVQTMHWDNPGSVEFANTDNLEELKAVSVPFLSKETSDEIGLSLSDILEDIKKNGL